MKKLFIIAAVLLLILSGCVDDKKAKTADTPAVGALAAEETGSPVPASPQIQTSKPEQTQQLSEPSPAPEQQASADDTKEQLEELSDLLGELTGGEFSDIDLTE